MLLAVDSHFQKAILRQVHKLNSVNASLKASVTALHQTHMPLHVSKRRRLNELVRVRQAQALFNPGGHVFDRPVGDGCHPRRCRPFNHCLAAVAEFHGSGQFVPDLGVLRS